jgi:preprotein translocase subunit YajC
MVGMETLQVGDWVRTKAGHEGKVLLIARLSAFIEINGQDEMRTRPFLLGELAKVDPPTTSDKHFRPE